MTQRERAANMLFPVGGRQAANIKYYTGLVRSVKGERLAEQFIRAETQIRYRETQPCGNIDD